MPKGRRRVPGYNMANYSGSKYPSKNHLGIWRKDLYFISVGDSGITLDKALKRLRDLDFISKIVYCEEYGGVMHKYHWHFELFFTIRFESGRGDWEALFNSYDINIETPPYIDRRRVGDYIGKKQPRGVPRTWNKHEGEWFYSDHRGADVDPPDKGS